MISIIIPAYNNALLIHDTLESVVQSSFGDYEVLIVNDGSTDNLEEAIAPYLKDVRFRYISQENRGLAGARNTGIRASQGEYLVFLDSDDVILPDKLGTQSDYLRRHPDVDIVYSHSQWFVEDDLNDVRSVNFPVYEGMVLDQLIFGNFMHVNSVMVRRDKVVLAALFDERLRELEDWDLWLRMVIKGSVVGFTSGIMSKVRIRKGSMTSNQNRMDATMARVLTKTINSLEPNHPIQLKAHHALLIYRLKAGDTKGYLSALFAIQMRFGWRFAPITMKQMAKYFLRHWVKQNKTTEEIELIWKQKQ